MNAEQCHTAVKVSTLRPSQPTWAASPPANVYTIQLKPKSKNIKHIYTNVTDNSPNIGNYTVEILPLNAAKTRLTFNHLQNRHTFYTCDIDLDPITLIYEPDLDILDTCIPKINFPSQGFQKM